MTSPTYDISKSKISLKDGTYRNLDNTIIVEVIFLGRKYPKEMVVEARMWGRSIIEPGNALNENEYEKLDVYNSEADAELALVAFSRYVFNVSVLLSKEGKESLTHKLKDYKDNCIHDVTEQSDLTVHRRGVKLPIFRNAASLKSSLINGHFAFDVISFAFGMRQSEKDHYGIYSVLGLTEYLSARFNSARFDEGIQYAIGEILRYGFGINNKLKLEREIKLCAEVLDRYREKRGDRI